MKVHQIVLVVVDFDELGADEVASVLEDTRYPNRCINPHVRHISTRDIGEWQDDNPLNFSDTMENELIRLFGEPTP